MLLLGTPHLANPGRDLINVRVDDVLTSHRQSELEELGSQLATFRPTKVCVEVMPTEQTKLDAAFSAYVEGEGEARPSEVFQIGFRVARLCGLRCVHGIDDDAPMVWDELERFFSTNPSEDNRFKNWVETRQIEAHRESEEIARTPMRVYLRSFNAPERLADDAAWYVDMAGLGKIGEHPGAEMLASWYRRNVRIFSNLSAVTEAGDRIFVIMGAGHVPILRQLIELSKRHRLVDPGEYL